MAYLHDELLGSPREVLDYFLHDTWFRSLTAFDANRTGKGGMIFRGQSDANWGLIPSAFRPGRLKDFTPQPPPDEIDPGRLKMHLGWQLHAEARAIHLFLENADALGIPTPIDYTTTKHGLDLILAALNDVQDFDYSMPYPPESYQRATALAQHHGVPTRYLDWSESPLVACYFAAYGASKVSGHVAPADQEIAVAFMSSNTFFEKGSPAQLVRAPRHENSHLLQQHGIFASMTDANQVFLKNGQWPTLDDLSSASFQIHRVRLNAAHASGLLRLLFDLNITRHSLMPTLDHAAKATAYTQCIFEDAF